MGMRDVTWRSPTINMRGLPSVFMRRVGRRQLSYEEAKDTVFALHPCGLQRSMHANVLERRFSYDTRGWLFWWSFCSRANLEMALVVESDFIHPC
jgi:hypothetical protein